MNKLWFACQYQTPNGENYANIASVNLENCNMINMGFGKDCIVAMPCESRKNAIRIANEWEDMFAADGTAAFH